MNFADIDWVELFSFSMAPLEIFVRGSIMYWFLFAIFRFVLRRGASAVGIGDFLFVVIVADAAQNAMAGDSKTLADGIALVSTLISWNVLLDFLNYRFLFIRRLTEPTPLLLVKDGKMLRNNMRREYVTQDELEAKLRGEGIEHLSQVKSMHLEVDGEITVVPKEKK